MQSLAARIASFKPPSRRTKNALPTWNISPSTHPHLTPQKLAEAGFYFNPSIEEPDNCRCFSCGLQLGGWDEEDDPFVEQCKRSDCAWGEMVCAPRVARDRDEINMTVTDEDLLPSSAASTQTRILTFQDTSGETYWPHKPKKSWKPSVENVAAAGFVFLETPDDVMCPYCQYTIGAWEASDDPMEVHQTKKPNCPFFTITLESQPVKPTGKAAPKPRATRAKRTTTATVAASQAGSVMGQEDEAPESSEPAKKGRKARATTAKGKGKKVAESEIADSVMEEDEEESQAVIPKEVEKPKRRGGGRSKKVDVEPTEPEVEIQTLEEIKEVPEPKKKERNPRATKASKKAEAEAEALSKAEAEVEAEPVVENQAMDVVDKPPTPKTTKSTSSRATKSTKSNPSSKTTSASAPIPEIMPPPSVPSKSSRPIKSIRASKLDKSTKSAPSAAETPLPESIPASSSSSSQQPTTSKPPSSKSKSTSAPTTSKPLPPTPKTTYPANQPLNQLTHFANVPPTSPMVPEDPMREELNTDLGEMAKSARSVVTPSEGEEWMKEPLTAAEKKMTIEQLINRQMGRRALVIEEEGEEMIRKWKEGAVAIRSQIQAALR